MLFSLVKNGKIRDLVIGEEEIEVAFSFEDAYTSQRFRRSHFNRIISIYLYRYISPYTFEIRVYNLEVEIRMASMH